VKDQEFSIKVLKRLKGIGVAIAIDDFGTGYSSLSYLKRFPVDYVKIDQSFVQDVATDPDATSLVTAIISMAHSLNLKTIAEGVETRTSGRSCASSSATWPGILLQRGPAAHGRREAPARLAAADLAREFR